MSLSTALELPAMIAIDMDGTLVHPEGYVTAGNREALQRARDAGIRIVIATGRRHNYAMKVLRDASMQPGDVVLSSNGAVARTIEGALVFRQTMPLHTARWLCSQLQGFRNALVLTFDADNSTGTDEPGTLVLEDFDEVHRSIQRWVDSNARYIQRVKPIENALREWHLPIQAMLCGSVERMHAAEAHLAAAHGGALELFRTEYPARDLCILDMMPAGVSKGSGLQTLLARANLSPANLMCLGDNWNDLPMLDLARWPVLMGNAPEALLQLAQERGWSVMPRHDSDAVAQAIHETLDGVTAELAGPHA